MQTSSNEKRRLAVGFAAAGAAMTVLFLAIVNYLTYWAYPWFLYPAFAVIWWPVSVAFANRSPRVFAIVGSLMILLFLATINLVFSPMHLWVLYAAFPVLCWPAVMFLGKRAGRFPAALAVSLLAVVYYIFLNKFYSPGFPWFIFPTYAVMWWPLSVLLAKRKKVMAYSLGGALWTIAFFIVLNAVTTPFSIWAVYPIFGVLWWPLSIFCFVFMRKPAV
jgi:hypothetical protein